MAKMTDDELKDLVASLAVAQKELAEQQKKQIFNWQKLMHK